MRTPSRRCSFAIRWGFGLGSLAVLAACGSDGAAGAQGEPGAAGPAGNGLEPSAGVVVPNVGLLDREHDVVVTVESLKLEAPPTLDFGAGITVSDVQLVSTSTVLAHVKVSPTAVIGTRDVKITAGSSTVTGTKAFKVLAPIEVKVSSGKAEQGNIVTVDLVNRDRSAFDTAEGSFEVAGDGLTSLGGTTTATNAQRLLLVDPLAAAGASRIVAANLDGAGSPTITFRSDPAALQVTPRAPVALAAGTNLTAETFPGNLETKMYKLSVPAQTATTASILSVVFKTAIDDLTNPLVWAVPTSGKMADLLLTAAPAQASFFGAGDTPPFTVPIVVPLGPGAAALDTYLVAVDQGAGTGNKFTIEPQVIAAKLVSEDAAAHATKAGAQKLIGGGNACAATAATFTPCLVAGEIKASAEVDVYSVAIPTADKLEVAINADKPSAVAVGVFDAAAASGASVDLNDADAIAQASAGEKIGLTKSTVAKTTWIVVVEGGAATKYSLSLRVAP
jgi:hypothetical protein